MPPTHPDLLTDQRCRRYGWLILLLLTAVLYLPGTAVLPLMDRDEPRFAHATVEMMQRGSWAVPYFNGEYRFDKPPLTYWWMAWHYELLGVHELSARLHTTFAVWLVALVIASIGRRLHSIRAGLLAGLAWLLTLQVLVHGRLCVADMPLVLFITLALRAVVELLQPGVVGFNRWHWLFYAALGFGFLAKGPLALLVPALALVLTRFLFWRKPLPWGRLKVWPGLLITLGIAAAWGIPALIETHGLFWKVGMGEHVVDRGTKAFNGRFPVPGYYLVTAFLSLFPWIAFLPALWSAVRRNWSIMHALLVGWFAAPYLIFTFYATQLPHYVMPGFPAAMLLLATSGALTFTTRWHRVWAVACLGLFLAVGLALLVLRQSFAWPVALQPLLLHSAAFLVSLAFAGTCLIWLVLSQGRSALLSTALAALAVVALLHLVCLDIRKLHPAVTLAERFPGLPEKAELIGCRFAEPSLVFHFQHQWRFISKKESLEKRMQRPGPRLVVLLNREWTLSDALQRWLSGKDQSPPGEDLSAEVDALAARYSDYQRSSVSVFNAARSSWAELVILERLQDHAPR